MLANHREFHAGKSLVDDAVGGGLARSYGRLTRRSFLAVVTRKVFAVAGFSLAAEAFPYFVPRAEAQDAGSPEWCGLHARKCNTGNCSSSLGQPGTEDWVQCCPIPTGGSANCTTVYRCCRYTDYCSTGYIPPPQNCLGPVPSGREWCGSTPGEIVCTEVSCDGNFTDQNQCRTGCQHRPIGGFCPGGNQA